MRVFNACVKILWNHKNAFFTHIIIFVGLLLGMIFINKEDIAYSFETEMPKYAFVVEDTGGPLTEGLAEILEQKGRKQEIGSSREDLMDAGFFGAVEGIFVIQKGYEEAFWNGEEEKLGFWQRPSSASGYYLESVAEQYLFLVRLNREMNEGLSEEEIVQRAVSAMKIETKVTMKQYEDSAVVSEKIHLAMRFMPYIFLMAEISCVTIIFLNFRRPEIRMRNLCSPMHPFSVAAQKILFTCAVAAVLWIVINGITVLVCLQEWRIIGGKIQGLLMFNSFLCMVQVIPIALLCGCMIRSMSSQPFISNSISLGMCFLSGVFVPLELLSEDFLRVGKFFPIYWYEENLKEIAALTGVSGKYMNSIWENFGVQAGFAVMLFLVYLLVSKYMDRDSQSYGVSQTEIEL